MSVYVTGSGVFGKSNSNCFSTFCWYALVKDTAMKHQHFKGHDLSVLVTESNGVEMGKLEING